MLIDVMRIEVLLCVCELAIFTFCQHGMKLDSEKN